MASGCIIGECPYCNDLIYEDEWILTRTERVAHIRCENKYTDKDKRILALESKLRAAERKIKELEGVLQQRGGVIHDSTIRKTRRRKQTII